MSKDYPSCVKFETSIGFTKILFFNIPNEWSKKKFHENNISGFFVQNHKKNIFPLFLMLLIFRRAYNSPF
jgi:hypothetical protein